jgi:chromate transporter
MGGGGHGKVGKVQVDDADTLLGEESPEHTQVSRAMLSASRRVPHPLAGAGRAAVRGAGPANVFAQIAGFFSIMAVVTFGGAYAVLAYVAQEAVQNFGWLAPGEMLDGLGMAETTPGTADHGDAVRGLHGRVPRGGGLSPLMAGTLGGLLTTWVTFTPCFLWIFLGAPFIERLRDNKVLTAALTGDHCCRGRRHPEPRGLVRPACGV